MNRYGVLAANGKDILGFIKAKDFAEAKALVSKKTPLIDPDFSLKDLTIGFSDQYVVEEISYTVNENYDPKTAIVLAQMLYIFDDWIGTRLVSTRKDQERIAVYGFDFGDNGTAPKSYLEHINKLPGVLSYSFTSVKEFRHWYWTGWVYYYKNVKYYRVYNSITFQKGYVKAGGDFSFQRTALETNFGTIQKNLNDLEKNIYDNIITPAKEGLDYFKKLGYVSLLIGSLFLISKTNKE